VFAYILNKTINSYTRVQEPTTLWWSFSYTCVLRDFRCNML